MKYSIDKKEQYSLVSLEEEKLDASVAPELKSELITMHAEGTRNLILDMGHREVYRFIGAECSAGWQSDFPRRRWGLRDGRPQRSRP